MITIKDCPPTLHDGNTHKFFASDVPILKLADVVVLLGSVPSSDTFGGAHCAWLESCGTLDVNVNTPAPVAFSLSQTRNLTPVPPAVASDL